MSPAPDVAVVTDRDESRILFVGTRNTGLSVAAERIARQRFGGLGLTFESAGVDAEPGSPLADDVRAALDRRGADTTSHAARRVDRDAVARAGLVLALDRSQRRRLVERWPAVAMHAAVLTEAAAVSGWATAGPVATSRSGAGVARLDGTGRHTGAPTAQWLVRQCTHEARFDLIGSHGADDEVEDAVRRLEDALAALLPWYARAIRS